MLRYYEDIISRIKEEPLWYDENGVPRYDMFKPNMCGVYDHQVALLQISCQCCNKTFKVAFAWDSYSNYLEEAEPFPTKCGSNRYHYGDPPRHNCIGDSMNSIPERVLEFWRRANVYRRLPEWKRHPMQEIIWKEWDSRIKRINE